MRDDVVDTADLQSLINDSWKKEWAEREKPIIRVTHYLKGPLGWFASHMYAYAYRRSIRHVQYKFVFVDTIDGHRAIWQSQLPKCCGPFQANQVQGWFRNA